MHPARLSDDQNYKERLDNGYRNGYSNGTIRDRKVMTIVNSQH
ncbi:MAG: hypothetical protein ACI84C_002507, partial [Flavobacteriales bacterium]